MVIFKNICSIMSNVLKNIGRKDDKMERKRGFEIAKGFENEGINIPERKTKFSAGYDIESAQDCIIPAYVPGQKPTLVKTGLKAYMNAFPIWTKLPQPGQRPGPQGRQRRQSPHGNRTQRTARRPPWRPVQNRCPCPGSWWNLQRPSAPQERCA